jgi:myo-inositol-1(or 4)-monophosphatase
MYDAALGEGARFNGQPLVRKRHPGRTAPLIPAPGAVHQELQNAALEYTRGPAYPSLAYRLVQVATGHLDAAVTRRGAQDWDIAGAACILKEAGVGFEDVCIGALRFNRPEIRHGALAALGEPSLKAPLHAALVKVYGCPQPQEVDLERR